MLAVRLGEDGQRLDAEQHDGGERHEDGHERHDEPQPRRLGVLEQHPDPPQRLVLRQHDLLRRVALGELVRVHGFLLELVEEELAKEDVIGDVERTAQSAPGLEVDEDRLEAGPVAVEEQLPVAPVEVPSAAAGNINNIEFKSR